MSQHEPLVATASQTVGPFFHFGLTPEPNGRMADRLPRRAATIRLTITMFDGDGQPVGDAMVELWHDGAFGRMPTNANGTCEFETIRPRAKNAGAAPCINAYVFARGLLRPVLTRIYFAGDPANASDQVLAMVPENRRSTLLARPATDGSARWTFTIRLQGTDETVFFDA